MDGRMDGWMREQMDRHKDECEGLERGVHLASEIPFFDCVRTLNSVHASVPSVAQTRGSGRSKSGRGWRFLVDNLLAVSFT